MRFFRDLSINAKLMLSAMVAGGTALLLASIALLVNDFNLMRSSKVEQLSALAKVLGANCTAALTFDDPAAAKELLASLNLQPTIVFACVMDAKGKVFADYQTQKAPKVSHNSPKLELGYTFTESGLLEVTQPIEREGERIGTVCLHASMSDLNRQLLRNAATVAVVMLAAMLVVLFFSSRLQRSVSEPIFQLANIAQQISRSRDYSMRVEKFANDELGTLYDEFNAMLGQIERNERQLQQAHDELELRVEQRTRELSEANLQLSNEIGERKRAEAELEVVHQQLLDAARRAGMAEVATGVLHNVGNVLNSINVSATLVADRVRSSKINEWMRAMQLLKEHEADLGDYLTKDDRGKRLPGFLQMVAEHMNRTQNFILDELGSLTKNIDHVKTIVAMQQSYAGAAGVVELVSLPELVEDALRMNASSFEKHGIEIIRDYDHIPEVRMEKQKLLQILMNLLTNAKDSLIESSEPNRRLVVRIRVEPEKERPRILIEVVDNGIGIPKEHLTRIFSHGFTTKRYGHGFGLHSSANAAHELGGTLTARSDGPGCGATFTLELPYKPVEVLT